jgi:ketosteroid isomerase-like protein
MERRIEQIAEDFSRHRFAETYPYLLEDVRWDVVGDKPVVGKEAVVAACGQSADYLAGVTTRFTKFKVVVGADSVVVDSVAEYDDGGESSSVASCDIYDFTDGRVAAITSYTVELGSG